jgi:hypothetical protein
MATATEMKTYQAHAAGTGTRILFLDFDDVLNTAATLARGELFERANVEVLNAVIDRTDAAIVVTSMWRIGARLDELETLLVTAGVHAQGRVVGVTPCLEERSRGAEISAWLRQSPLPIGTFVILDDRSDMDIWAERLVQTDPHCGLVRSQVDEIVDRLQGKNRTGTRQTGLSVLGCNHDNETNRHSSP